MALTEAEKQQQFYANQAKQDALVESLFVNPDSFVGGAEAQARAKASIEKELNPFQLQQSIDRVTRRIEQDKKREGMLAVQQEQERIADLTPEYRESYDAGKPTTFAEAKKAADETYLQYWYDKANDISKDWTREDYNLIANPVYKREDVNEGKGRPIYKDVRQLPKGYDEYKEYQDRIKAGPLDFSSEETHKMLIKPPPLAGGRYTKKQYWIDEDNPLRQAVEAQSDVMKDFLDDAGIPLVQKYEDLEGFKRPDSFRGEGIYLNTGTGAHIDWDSSLKRMQRYQSSPDAEIGSYTQVFTRPDPEGLGKPLTILGALSGNPIIKAAGAVASGGDLEDIVKSYVASQITTPVLEETFATLGVDADLFGMDDVKFSENMMDVQETLIGGGSASDALLKEFGKEGIKAVADAVDIDLPDIDFDTPEILEKVGDAIVDLAKPVLEKVEDVAKPVIDKVQELTEPVIAFVEEKAPVVEDIFIDPVKEKVEEFVEPVIAFVEEKAPVVEDIFIDPVKETIQAVTEPAIKTVEEVAPIVEDIVIDPIKETAKKAVETVADLGEPVIDTLDEALDVLGEKVVDPALQAGSDVLSEGEDILKATGSKIDDLVNWENLVKGSLGIGGALGMMASPTSVATQPTQVENLFDKELFKFKTEIGISPEYTQAAQATAPVEQFVDLFGGEELQRNDILNDLIKRRSYSL